MVWVRCFVFQYWKLYCVASRRSVLLAACVHFIPSYLLDEETKYQLFDSSLATLVVLSKRNDDVYVVSTLNTVFNFLHQFIPVSYRHHHERQRKKRLIPIIELTMKNPSTRIDTSKCDRGYRKSDSDDANTSSLVNSSILSTKYLL